MARPGLFGSRWKERKMRNSMPPENRRKNWLTRKQRETMADYVNRTKKVFAWGAKSLRARKNSNIAQRRMGTSWSNRRKTDSKPAQLISTTSMSTANLGTVAWQHAIGHLYQLGCG